MRKVPEATVERLVRYLRFAEESEKRGEECLTAEKIAESFGINPHLIRKDLAYFGQFGKRGKGYNTQKLKNALREILYLNKRWKVALIGTGNLGSALLRYPGFKKRGFDICCAFDISPGRIGRRVGGIEIESMENFEKIVGEKRAKIAILAVPSESVEEVFERIKKTEIKGILNFAPHHLIYPSGKVLNADLSFCMENLTFYL